MFELMNLETYEHHTLHAENFYAALDEAKKNTTCGNYAIINNRTMNIIIRFSP